MFHLFLRIHLSYTMTYQFIEGLGHHSRFARASMTLGGRLAIKPNGIEVLSAVYL
jgi:hypothetical protein